MVLEIIRFVIFSINFPHHVVIVYYNVLDYQCPLKCMRCGVFKYSQFIANCPIDNLPLQSDL